MNNKKIIILTALSAFILGLSRLPVHLGFISFCGFIPLLMVFDLKPKSSQIFKSAFVFSFVYCATALHWISLVTLPGLLGMVLLFTLYFLILFHMINIIWYKVSKLRFTGFLLLWLSFEHLQNFGPFGFPWFYSGYALGDYNLLLQPAEIGGITLISAFVIFTNTLIYRFIRNKNRNILTSLILIHLLWTGLSVWRYHTIELEDTKENIAIVQVSIPQNLKWEESYKDTALNLYSEYTGKTSEDAGLVVFPESAIPGYVLSSYKYGTFVKSLIFNTGKQIFTGFPEYVYDRDKKEYLYYNSCTLFDLDGSYEDPYRKNILVPVGERIPLMDVFPVLNRVELGQANWEYGKGHKYYNYKGIKLSPQICFEIAFPQFNAEMAKNNPDVILNLTNDAWFYHSAGTYQHSIMTRFRAIETRTQYYRAANTGVSMIVNPRGDILARSQLFTREVIEAHLYNAIEQSVFVKYLWNLPNAVAGIAALLLLFAILKKC